MPSIPLGHHLSLTHVRYTLTLSTSKRLVLFRLPVIAPSSPSPSTTPPLTLPSKDLRSDDRRPNQSPSNQLYYAMEATCPHAGGPMAQAQIDIEDSAYIASCPWHDYDFNVETGESSFGVKACTWPVVVDEEGVVRLEVDEGEEVTLKSMEAVSEVVRFKHRARRAVVGEKGDEDGNVDRLVAETAKLKLDENATLCDWCVEILNTSDPERKIELTTQLFSQFAIREATDNPMQLGAGTIEPPEEPPRPANLQQLEPWKMPNQGRGGSLKSRITMLHALANIEQWAIDLAIDICVRFATFTTHSSPAQSLPRTFFHDWLRVANDEAKHFSLLRSRLEFLGSSFGSLPVHHGLWESALRTSHDLRARISVIALVHEARGLDVNPLTIEKFRKGGDDESVEVLEVIHNDEVTHVTTGHRWLCWICEAEGKDPVSVFRGNVKQFFKGAVKGPFNEVDRERAGMTRSYYEDLKGSPWAGDVIAGG